MSSAAEARFRIPVVPATTRAVIVIALDSGCDTLVARLAQSAWSGTTFAAAQAAAVGADRLLQEVAAADFVVMLVAAGADAPAVATIGEVCSDRRITTATCIVRAASATDEALSRTLAQVRPWSLMVVVASDGDYVEELLRSFR